MQYEYSLAIHDNETTFSTETFEADPQKITTESAENGERVVVYDDGPGRHLPRGVRAGGDGVHAPQGGLTMVAWNETVILANSESLAAATEVEELISGLRDPVVCVDLEDLEASADDTLTIEFEGAAGTYQADQRTLSEPQSYTIDIPQSEAVSVTSSNGVTYSIEVRANPS